MPELPEMQALAERLDRRLAGRPLEEVAMLGFSGLKTAVPAPDELVGRPVTSVGRRGKYLVVRFDGGRRIAVHLGQAGRLDVESPPKSTRPRGSVVRLVFDPAPAAGGDVGRATADGGEAGAVAVLVREHGTQRKAGWWVLEAGDDGPTASLGPEPGDAGFSSLVLDGDSNQQLHTMLRDQRVVAGIGRGYADDALNRAGLSPFASLRSLDGAARRRLLAAVLSVLDEALEAERRRGGGLSDPKLGDRFGVHNRAGQPCPKCGHRLERVSFESHEIAYCPQCQTGGRVLADRRLSRLLR
ncbi:MAG: DNA-formamidopyrimidine glycosylase family protein [Acidimicrobiales bacterium]